MFVIDFCKYRAAACMNGTNNELLRLLLRHSLSSCWNKNRSAIQV